MSFAWLKQYMPRSLYARAALILVLPVVVLQLVVSVAFIRRHLEDVTVQMARSAVREFNLIAEQAAVAGSPDEVMTVLAGTLETLQISVAFIDSADVPAGDSFAWYDYSARVVRDTIRDSFANTLAVQFPDNRIIRMYFGSGLGPVEVTFDRRRVTAAAPHQLIVTMLFFGLLMTVIAFLYMRNQLRPIKRLANAAQAFGRGHTVAFRPGGATEVRAAGSAFLDMRNRIERQIEQRTMMLSGISHDLRTPLTRLRLGLSLIEDDEARTLLKDVDEMERLVDAFLDFSRGTAEVAPEPVDPHELVTRIVGDAQREGKDVSLDAPVGAGEVMLRETAIRRAVENLIGNAVRYGSKARVAVVLTDKSLRIRVEDDGPGILPELREDAIKPFTRLDPARNQNRGSGVGLGLAIVADIARAHGGTLRLGESADLGGLQADIVIGR